MAMYTELSADEVAAFFWGLGRPRSVQSFFSSLKTEWTARKVYRTRDDARADVFDYIERFYNRRRRHSTLGYMSPVEFEEKAMLA